MSRVLTVKNHAGFQDHNRLNKKGRGGDREKERKDGGRRQAGRLGGLGGKLFRRAWMLAAHTPSQEDKAAAYDWVSKNTDR